jgi:hypothetical protein
MSTTIEVQVHLADLAAATRKAATEVEEYAKNENKWTAGVRGGEMAKITTVSAGLIHAADCAICTGWVD